MENENWHLPRSISVAATEVPNLPSLKASFSAFSVSSFAQSQLETQSIQPEPGIWQREAAVSYSKNKLCRQPEQVLNAIYVTSDKSLCLSGRQLSQRQN